MRKHVIVSASLLAGVAGQALAQPDGVLTPGDNYGSILWVQNQPTSFGDNIAGLGATPGDPATVGYGFEFAIPLSAIGSPNPANGIKIGGFISSGSGDYLSNQLFAADNLASGQGNLANPRGMNFGTAFAGDQYLTIVPQVVAGAPTMDGNLDTDGFWNGKRVWTQATCTGFGDNVSGASNPQGTATGSELDNLYAVVSNNGTPGDTSDDVLYLFIGGNVESNGNKLALFFDTQAGGQNMLLYGNVDWGFGFTNNISESAPGAGDGLTWDPGFEPDYLVMFNTSGGTMYVDYVTLPSVTPGTASYVGGTPPGSQPGGMGSGGSNTPAIVGRFNNRNTSGVAGCGASGGVVTPDNDVALGSEIDGVYGVIDGTKLRLLITGNLQINYNKLDLFFDVDPNDGQNQLRVDNPDGDFGALLRMGPGGNGAPNAGLGLTFDSDFYADYYVNVTNGGNPVSNYTNAMVLRANGPDTSSGFILDYRAFSGGDKATNNPMAFPATYADIQDYTLTSLATDCAPRTARNDPALVNTPGNGLAGLIQAAINNSNVGGVTGTDVTNAAGVTTGVELEIDLTELGWDGVTPIKVAGFINADSHGYVSNQVIGGIPTGADLGEPSSIDFSTIPGNQYVVVYPSTGGCTPTCDYNQDGGADTSDVIDLANDIASGTESFPGSCSDYNQDGGADTSDVIDIANAIASGNC